MKQLMRLKPFLQNCSLSIRLQITGLDKNGKLELFKDALSRLNNATFNTIQCDYCSENQLTDDQFKVVNTALLSKNEVVKIS